METHTRLLLVIPLLLISYFGTGIRSTSITDKDKPSNSNKGRDSLARKSFAKATMQFTPKLYDVLKDLNPNQNIIFSPTILSTNIAMLRPGTNGSTSTEIESTLRLTNLTSDQIKEGILEYLADYPDEDKVKFESAQRLFIPSTYKVNRDFYETVLDDYSELELQDGPIKTINFAQSVTSANKINNWFRKNTHGKINEIVNPEYFSGATKLVLASGLYFNGQWQKKFKPEKTKTELFYVNGITHYTNVQLMNQLGRFSYMDLPKLNGSAISIPYTGDRLTLIVMVPYELHGLPYMEQRFKDVELSSIVDGMKKRNVDVYIPKFQIVSNIVMNTHRAHLRRLGLETIVSTRDQPDFSKLSSKKGLHLDQVIQKVIFEINERGVQNPPKLKKTKNENEPVIFRADHPFIFFIYDRGTKTILLIGKKVQ